MANFPEEPLDACLDVLVGEESYEGRAMRLGGRRRRGGRAGGLARRHRLPALGVNRLVARSRLPSGDWMPADGRRRSLVDMLRVSIRYLLEHPSGCRLRLKLLVRIIIAT